MWSWKATEIAWFELAILPSPWIVSSGCGEIIKAGASSSFGDAKTKVPLGVSEFFPLVREETQVCPPFHGLSLNLLSPGRAPRPAFLILWATKTNSSSLTVCESTTSEQISIISRWKRLRFYWKMVHSDKGIMVYSDTHSGSKELPSPRVVARAVAENFIWGKVRERCPWARCVCFSFRLCLFTERHREYYREDGGGTSRVRAVVCHVNPS